ncbi:MAG: glycosyltransferase [Acidaminococcaceae bacterium]
MRVLQINSVCGYGSTGRIATDLYKMLEKNGHECLIAYGRGNAPKAINSYRIGTNFDNYVHAVKTRLFDLHGFGSKKATKEFIIKAKEYNPDVIHLHNIHGYFINMDLLFNYLKEVNKPVVWTLHDCWAFTGHCAYFDFEQCNKWKTCCQECTKHMSYPKSLIIDNSKYNYNKKKELFTGIAKMTIVTPSNWLANLVNLSFLKEYDVKVINNGIDLEVFNPKYKNIFRKKYDIEDKFLILGVANMWEDRKGFNYFLELSKVIDDESLIVLVGVDSDQLKLLPKNIIGIKRTNNTEELAEIYSTVDVFVNPTLEDNFPTTNLEALACGTPVITFNTGGSIESIDEKSGIIVEKGDFGELCKAISNSENLRLLKEGALSRAILYDKNERYKEYMRIYIEKGDNCEKKN